ILSADRHFALSFRTSVIALARVSLPAAVARRRRAYILRATQRRWRRLRRNRECGPIADIPSLHRCIVNDGCDPRSGLGLVGLGLVGLKPQATQDDHVVASSAPRLPPWAALSFAATARRSILPAPLSGSAATMSTKRGCE